MIKFVAITKRPVYNMPKSRYIPRSYGGRSSSPEDSAKKPKKSKFGWEQYSKDQLKDQCQDRQLSTKGSKNDSTDQLDHFFAKKNAEAASAAEDWMEAAVSRVASPSKSTLTQEQKELIELKRQAALLKRQGSLTSYGSILPLSQGSTSSTSPLKAHVINPYAKPVAASTCVAVAASPKKGIPFSSLSKPTLPPLPYDAPPIRQNTLDSLSREQLRVVEAARPPTATSFFTSSHCQNREKKSDSFHPIVRVTAAAGTGKTTTLLHLALRCIDLGHKELTYVTFSKSSAVDAQTRIQALLPDDKKSCIYSSTLHSCAMKSLSKQSEADFERGLMLEGRFRKLIEDVCEESIEIYLSNAYRNIMQSAKDKKEIKRKKKKAYDQVVFWLEKSFNCFCIKDISLEQLKDEKNSFRHYYPLQKYAFKPGEIASRLGFPLSVYSSEQSYKFFADQCVVLWNYVIENGIRTFDTEMKRAQLNQVRIPGSALLVDECQDLDACQVDFIASQLQYGTAIFFVGDAAQTIYSFRGAKSSNYMSLPNAIDLCLNKSWRFGPSVARIANVPLFAKEYSPQTNNYLLSPRKQWIPYRIEGSKSEEESSVTLDSLIGKSKVTFIARTNFTLMFKAMEIMGFGCLAEEKDGNDSDVEESESTPNMTPSVKLKNVPKFHINGDGDLSGLKRWQKAVKEIRHLYYVYETTRSSGQGTKLPEKEFPEFTDKLITWKDFIEECKDRELNKYVQPIQIICKYGLNTIIALEKFELEVLDKKFSAAEADVILTTCHAAKGLEWDHVEICDDFVDLASRSYTLNGPLRHGPEFLSDDMSKTTRVSWQLNLQAYGDDINLLYVACTRAKKTLVVPQSINNLFADVDLIHYLVRDMVAVKEGAGTHKHSKDDPSSYASLNKSDKNNDGGRLSKGELWNLFNDVCKPLREELGVAKDDAILKSLFPSDRNADDHVNEEECDAYDPISEEDSIIEA